MCPGSAFWLLFGLFFIYLECSLWLDSAVFFANVRVVISFGLTLSIVTGLPGLQTVIPLACFKNEGDMAFGIFRFIFLRFYSPVMAMLFN